MILWTSFLAGPLAPQGCPGVPGQPSRHPRVEEAPVPWPRTTSSLACLSPGMRDRTQGGGDKTLGAKRQRAPLFQKCPLAPPRHARHRSRCRPGRTVLLLLLAPFLGARDNKPTRTSQGPSKRLRCCRGGRKPTITPFPPSPAPWGRGSAGKSLYFLTRGFLLGHRELPPPRRVSARCTASLPSSLPKRAAEADTYTGQNLFPNTSFISFSHEIFLSEYSLHLENRREVFF